MAGPLRTYNFKGFDLVRQGRFIETGAFRGETITIAARQGYEVCHSIEYWRPHYERLLAAHGTNPHIHFWLGSSPDILPHIIDPSRTTTFWLDAHFQGEHVQERDVHGECPLLAELKIILGFKWMDLPYIVIDDADIFIGKYPILGCFRRPNEWPNVEQIRSHLPGYQAFYDQDKFFCFPIAEVKAKGIT